MDVSGGIVIILHWGVQHPKRLTVVDGVAESTLPHAPTAYTADESAVRPADGSLLLVDLGGRAQGWS